MPIALWTALAIAGAMQNTGEGGVASHHQHGGELIWQIGTGYFGARNDLGHFSMERLKAVVARVPTIRGIEIKLSQGAKPGRGGVLPAARTRQGSAESRVLLRGASENR